MAFYVAIPALYLPLVMMFTTWQGDKEDKLSDISFTSITVDRNGM